MHPKHTLKTESPSGQSGGRASVGAANTLAYGIV